jgi:phospholipid/cholesterol/gamma-HCH transport system substrate-binding protein
MATKTHAFKLGLFVLFTIAVSILSASALFAHSNKKETVSYHTYFNESVQGLEVGAPVRFRGVPLGTVNSIVIAPDHRHVDVEMALDVEAIRRMGLIQDEHAGAPRFLVPTELRAQLASQGITGVKFLLLDYFDVKVNPLPDLPFTTDPNSIPAAVSLFKSLEENLIQALDNLPGLLARAESILRTVDVVLEEIRLKGLPDQVLAVVVGAREALKDFRIFAKSINEAELPQGTASALASIDRTVAQLSALLGRLDGKEGLVSSVVKTSNSLGRVGDSAEALDETLRDVGEAAQAVRDLAEVLERDSDMLLKGREKVVAP